VDKINEEWLDGELNFYFRYKRQLLESLSVGKCLNIGCGSHLIEGATNIDEGLPEIPYPDKSFDTVVCSDVLEHIGNDKKSIRTFSCGEKKNHYHGSGVSMALWEV